MAALPGSSHELGRVYPTQGSWRTKAAAQFAVRFNMRRLSHARLHNTDQGIGVMTETPAFKLLDRLRPLWLLLTGGAFVSFAGTALTLFYFWGIGGVPIGQAASAGAMAKIVLSSALFLAMLFFMAWLAPAIMAHMMSDESPFAVRLRHWFSPPRQSSDSVLVGATDLGVAGQSEPVGSVSWKRISGFALSTVGVGCLGLTLMASGVGRDRPDEWSFPALLICLIAPGIAMGALLIWQYLKFRQATRDAAAPQSRSRDWLAWGLFGCGSAVISLFPLLILLLVFIKTDVLQEQETYWAFWAGAAVISFGIVAAFSVSLAVLVRRRQGVAVRWAMVLGVNALILLVVVMVLGISSRILEAVMVLSSVRVENAVLVLEPDGCELLQSMRAQGWGRVQGASDRTCMLYDVTIQSTLEPSMQVACWRRILSKKDAAPPPVPAASVPASSVAATATPGTAPPASAASLSMAATPASAAKTAPATGVSHATDQMIEFSGRNGAFTIPTKLVRSVWKTGGAKLEAQPPVCPSVLMVSTASSSEEPSTTR
jgi:hypothetical protein